MDYYKTQSAAQCIESERSSHRPVDVTAMLVQVV